MNTFILRWNPAISSYKMEEHKRLCEQIKEKGTVLYNWSVRDWESLYAGDAFVLLKVGTETDGIAMIGKFISESYEGDNWRKDGTKIHYADMQIFYACDLDKMRSLRAVHFEKHFPHINWHGGHSGELLSENESEKLVAKIDSALKNMKGFGAKSFTDFLENDRRFLPIKAEEKKAELLELVSAYNPVVHTGEEDGWDWLFDDDEFAIEIKNPSGEADEQNLCIAFEDSVNNEFTLYFAGWHKYFKMNEGEYADFLSLLKAILENKMYVLTAYDKDSESDAIVTELLPVGTEVKAAFWSGKKSVGVHIGE